MGIETRFPRYLPTKTLRALGALVLVLSAFIVSAVPANAQDSAPAIAQDSAPAIAQDSDGPSLQGVGPNGFVDVIEVNGLLDPVLVNFIDRSLDGSLDLGARAVVLQMESEGAAIDDESLTALATRIANYLLARAERSVERVS